MNDLVLREDQDGIAVLTLNRPEALNALSPNLFDELHRHIGAIGNQIEDVGCVILRGAGRSFSAGNDLKAMRAGETAPRPEFQAETLEMIEDLAQPVIAEVQGHCYTGALELALACDLLVCAQNAKFADTHGKWAMTPGWGMSQRLPRRIGLLKAKELMLTGRVVGGSEAADLGLANFCVADDQIHEAALKLARDMLENSWHTLRGDKMLLNRGQELGLKAGLKFEREEGPGRGPDLEERIKRFGGG